MLCLKLGGEAIEERPQGAAAEVDEGAFLFIPKFEHKIYAHLVENYWGDGNNNFLGWKVFLNPPTAISPRINFAGKEPQSC